MDISQSDANKLKLKLYNAKKKPYMNMIYKLVKKLWAGQRSSVVVSRVTLKHLWWH